jgi:hypothetical protein
LAAATPLPRAAPTASAMGVGFVNSQFEYIVFEPAACSPADALALSTIAAIYNKN